MDVPRPPGSLQREIQQTRPFASTGQEAVLGLLRTADLLRRLTSNLLEPHGITPQQYNVLRILRGAGKGGIATLAIRDRMLEQTPGITRLLDRLESKGWVRRERQTDDRRQVLCWITAPGRKLLSKLDRPLQSHVDAAVGMLSERELQRLIRSLDRIRAGHEKRQTDHQTFS